MNIGTAIKNKLDGRKQIWLANKSGISKSHLSSVMIGNRDPSLSALRKISDALGVRLSEIIKEAEKHD